MLLQYSIQGQQPQVLIGVTNFTIKKSSMVIEHSGGAVECEKDIEDFSTIYCESQNQFRVSMLNNNVFTDLESNITVIQKISGVIKIDGVSVLDSDDYFIHVHEL